MLGDFQSDPVSSAPLYRQLADHIRNAIKAGSLRNNDRLPPTRELAGALGLNRTTVSAAYSLLEQDGLLEGHVGRGSFVRAAANQPKPQSPGAVSFTSSQPAQSEFPLDAFRETCAEVTGGPDAASILQLGSPLGYPPLRNYLLETARAEGCLGPEDDILITSGCQQALDLIQRALVPPDGRVAIEDPVYHGVRNVFARAAQALLPLRMTEGGVDLDALEQTLSHGRPSLLVITPNFQNPTGETLSRESRLRLLEIAARYSVTIVENDTYGALRYTGESLPTLKQLDPSAPSLLLRSFSKVSFPGMRVGWIIGPKHAISKLAEARQWCDLHSDQLSQAILLRFAESGRLAAHLDKVRETGRQRLEAVLDACSRFLPPGATFSRPEGGMNIWVRLPEPLDASVLLVRAEREQITFLPGRHFAVANQDARTLRLSFGSLSPAQIQAGVRSLGQLAFDELERGHAANSLESFSAAVV